VDSKEQFYTKFGLEIFQKLKYLTQWMSPFFYMETKFGPLEKKNKNLLTLMEMKIFRRTSGCTDFDRKRNEEISLRAESKNS
jgi:predicted acetyltransferase